MPTIHRESGYSFRFYSRENNEPPHIHVWGKGGQMKVWLNKDLEIEEVYNIPPHEQTKILKIIESISKNFYMNDLNLKNENKINNPVIKAQEHLTILGLECKSQTITADLSDGRSVSVPIAWFKKLRQAKQEQLNNYKLSPAGCAIHWEELDEDISIKSFLNGLRGGCCH